MNHTEPISDPSATAARPLGLTIICVIIFLGSLMVMMATTTEDFQRFPASIRYIFLSSVALNVVAAIGIFLMRRWGVVLYAAVLVVSQGLLISLGSRNLIALAVSLLITAVGFAYFNRMR